MAWWRRERQKKRDAVKERHVQRGGIRNNVSVAILAQATVLPRTWRCDVSHHGPRCSRSFGTHPCKLAGWHGFSWHAYHHFEALSAASRQNGDR